MKPAFRDEMGELSEEKLGWEVDIQQQVKLVEIKKYEALPAKA